MTFPDVLRVQDRLRLCHNLTDALGSSCLLQSLIFIDILNLHIRVFSFIKSKDIVVLSQV
jgi:hypothetical protein